MLPFCRVQTGEGLSESCQEKVQAAVIDIREEMGLPSQPLSSQRPTRRAHRQKKWKRKKYTGKKKSNVAKEVELFSSKRLFLGFFLLVTVGLGVLYYHEFQKMVKQGKIGGDSKRKKKKKN